MFAQLNFPDSLHPHELDDYLAHGWFRMGQTIFTTNFLKFSGIIYSAIWLRIDLSTFEKTKTQQKLEKLNAGFKVVIQPIQLNEKQETLFQKYSNHITFDASPSLENLLFNNGENDIFNTYEVSVYDQEKLIATGFFDLGDNSAAGITCFYDPDYKKHSLGKFLMYQKIDFCKNLGIRYFYPGYFAPGYPLFDYKLDLAKNNLEYLDIHTNNWLSFENFSKDNIPFVIMTQKLKALSEKLNEIGFEHTFFKYDYFDADLMTNLNGLNLFDFPIFIFCFEVDQSNPSPIIVYDIRDSQYHLLLSSSVFRTYADKNIGEHYSTNLLKTVKYLYSSESANIMANIVSVSLIKTI
ncbi:arginyl-tRNA--protein arginylyltransferase [Arcicella rosea]|uniref:Arginine-tRNA-protein transferase n=1 Tax=Arcicella rosea TaxID=502909 RepID=A0A841ESQ2_9BACT|nr:arginyl-tRNA--protein arginylyltransferase [Arcicella rosea]MBB6004063.1 arginine-tRNA-protein transferase [Arcicella rosea]